MHLDKPLYFYKLLKIMVYRIEITNDESIFLYYTLNLTYNVINGTPSEVHANITSPEDAKDTIRLILDGRDKLIQDAAGNDKSKANLLWVSLSKKIMNVMNTERD